jgi:hypothetical protein
MTWKRARQLSAETQSLADVVGLTGSTGATISATEKYTGGYSYRFFGSGQPLGIAGLSHTAARAGMFFRHNGITGTGFAPIIGMMVDGAPVVWGLNLLTSEITLRAGWISNTSTVHFPLTVTSTIIAANNQWYSIGMTANFAAENGFVTLWANGQQVATWAGDTRVYRSGQTTPRTQITGCYAVGGPSNWMTGTSSWSSATYTDDFYVDVWDGVGNLIDAPPPSRRFLAVFPNRAGSTTQWTAVGAEANWAAVDEAPPNNDTDYVRAAAGGLLDTYDFAAVSVPADHAIRAVIPMAYVRKSDAGIDSRLRLVVGMGSNIVKSDAKALTVGYEYVWERWETQPNSMTPWSESAVNDAEFGIESAGEF